MAEEIEDKVVEAMRALGFNATDAKTYLALLKEHPATGYELATRSGVPRSAIYNVLNIVADKPARYVPLPPEKLFGLLEVRFARSLESLRDGIDQLARKPNQSVTWTVEGYEAMLEQAEQLVGQATTRVVASLWGREAQQLERALRAAVARGVDVVLFGWTPLPDVGRVFSYGVDPSGLEPHWDHRIILLSDRRRLLVGAAEVTEDNRAVVTDEPALIEIAIANLVLDLTLLGERKGVEVAPIVAQLTDRLAPVEALMR